MTTIGVDCAARRGLRPVFGRQELAQEARQGLKLDVLVGVGVRTQGHRRCNDE